MNKIADDLREFYQEFESDDHYNPIYYDAADEIDRLDRLVNKKRDNILKIILEVKDSYNHFGTVYRVSVHQAFDRLIKRIKNDL